MGCFSFLCQECNKGILSNSYRGELVKLFLIKDKKIIEQMEGEYDSYGRVFDRNLESIDWEMDWDKVCDLMFNETGDGIAAIHTKCWQNELPTVQSDSDPNQGWGDEGEYFCDCEKEEEFND